MADKSEGITKRGGARKGSGRKHSSKGGKTKPKRVPVRYIDVVDELIEFIDSELPPDKINKSKAFEFEDESKNKKEIVFEIKIKAEN